MNKLCNKCNTVKSIDNYYIRSNKTTYNQCKQCVIER